MFLVVNYRAQMILCCMNCPAIFKKLFLKIVLRILCLWILFRKISARASEELWTFAVCSVYFNSVGMGVFFLFLVRNSCVSIKSLCCLKMSLLPCGYFFSHILLFYVLQHCRLALLLLLSPLHVSVGVRIPLLLFFNSLLLFLNFIL